MAVKNKVIDLQGDEIFEVTPECAKEAIKDLSRRPDPEITGAIRHSLAALECLSRKVTGEPTMTLGKLIKENPQIVPQPLNDVVAKIFGFASIKGRHLEEGYDPTFEEAELMVYLSAAICTYLCKTVIP